MKNPVPRRTEPRCELCLVTASAGAGEIWFLFLICEGNLTRAQGQKDTVEDRAFIYTRHACGVFGSNGLNGGPFLVGEFIPQDSSLPLGRFKHDLGTRLNSERIDPREAKS